MRISDWSADVCSSDLSGAARHACMVLSDSIRVMLRTHDKWKTFTTRPMPPSDSSEVMLAISCESKEEVNRLADTAGANGGIADPNPVQDHGFMFSRSFADPDGHIWEVAWMDPAVASGAQRVPAVEASA